MALLYLTSAMWPDRYAIGKTTFYARLKQLNIHPVHVEGKKETFLTESQFLLFEQHNSPVVGCSLITPLELDCSSVEEQVESEQKEGTLARRSSALVSSDTGALGEPAEQLDEEFQEIDGLERVAGIVTEEDLEDIDHRAQQRAGTLEIVENYATLSYRSTGAYTDESVKSQVAKSREILKSALRGKSPVQDPKSMMDRLRMKLTVS